VKALTICQPYAELICRKLKRVENRNWSTSYRGPLLIHAGKSRKWMTTKYGISEDEMAFGAIVGICDLVDCLSVNVGPHGLFNDPAAYSRWPWLRGHEHISGPNCLVIDNVRRIKEPVPYRGAQGFFEVPDHILKGII
jgi:activating signal cointegrator 1